MPLHIWWSSFSVHLHSSTHQKLYYLGFNLLCITGVRWSTFFFPLFLCSIWLSIFIIIYVNVKSNSN
jgi:hypothetical protein